MRKQLSKSEWRVIREEYRAGVIPVVELCQIYDININLVTQRALKEKWIKDQCKTVRRKTREKLTTMEGVTTDAELVDAAVERNLAVIRKHQAAIDQVAVLEAELLTELGLDPTKTWIGQYQGDIVSEDLNLTVAEKSAALKSLSAVQATRITLERQLLNLDEADRNADKLMIVLD